MPTSEEKLPNEAVLAVEVRPIGKIVDCYDYLVAPLHLHRLASRDDLLLYGDHLVDVARVVGLKQVLLLLVVLPRLLAHLDNRLPGAIDKHTWRPDIDPTKDRAASVRVEIREQTLQNNRLARPARPQQSHAARQARQDLVVRLLHRVLLRLLWDDLRAIQFWVVIIK